MGVMICHRHGMTLFVHTCPHVMKAVRSVWPAPEISYRAYTYADDPDLADYHPVGCWFCPKCIKAHDLPPDGTALPVAVFDELMQRTRDLYQPMCCNCFEEWGQPSPLKKAWWRFW